MTDWNLYRLAHKAYVYVQFDIFHNMTVRRKRPFVGQLQSLQRPKGEAY